MGRDKATLVLGGERNCAETIASLLIQVADPVIEVGRGASGLRAVQDESPGAGPLAAVASGWHELKRLGHPGSVIVLATDLPFVSVAMLRFLAEFPGSASVVPIVDGHPQPLFARFAATTLEGCDELLAAGKRSLKSLLEVSEVSWVGPEIWSEVTDERCFTDIDTPEDLSRAMSRE